MPHVQKAITRNSGGRFQRKTDPRAISHSTVLIYLFSVTYDTSSGELFDLKAVGKVPIDPKHPSPQETAMPAKSKSQQKAAGAALAAKRGDTKKSDLKGPARQMMESMSEKELEKMASTSRKNKPEHVSKS
jgi:hypothetical protein